MPREIIEEDEKQSHGQRYPHYRVVLFSDDHNTFEHVIKCLRMHIPGMSEDRACKLTLKVHTEGCAAVWRGPKEVAEMYLDLLKSEGLTARLEPDA